MRSVVKLSMSYVLSIAQVRVSCDPSLLYTASATIAPAGMHPTRRLLGGLRDASESVGAAALWASSLHTVEIGINFEQVVVCARARASQIDRAGGAYGPLVMLARPVHTPVGHQVPPTVPLGVKCAVGTNFKPFHPFASILLGRLPATRELRKVPILTLMAFAIFSGPGV